MNNAIFIPQRIRVGFQERHDTYTKKLAYVIYYDEKGTLRKAGSWEGWRDKKIEPVEYENIPMEGFVLNKKVGGYAGDWGNFRQAYVRVYDPRGFEFEISVPNLLYILEHTSSIKGKGLEGEFVYGWDGTELVLIPACSPDYINLTTLNEKRFARNTVKAKELKIGAEYLTKNNERYIYMGRFNAYENMHHFDGHWFGSYRAMEKYANEQGKPLYKENSSGWRSYYNKDSLYTYDVGYAGLRYFFYANGTFIYLKSISGLLIDTITSEPATNYAELFEQLESCVNYSPHDESKDVFQPLTKEEFLAHISRGYSYTLETMIDGFRVRFDLNPENYCDPNTKYTCSCNRYSNVFSMKDFFEHQPMFNIPAGRLVMIPVTLEEIYEKLHPYCTDQYLQNGKFYRRVYS